MHAGCVSHRKNANIPCLHEWGLLWYSVYKTVMHDLRLDRRIPFLGNESQTVQRRLSKHGTRRGGPVISARTPWKMGGGLHVITCSVTGLPTVRNMMHEAIARTILHIMHSLEACSTSTPVLDPHASPHSTRAHGKLPCAHDQICSHAYMWHVLPVPCYKLVCL